MVRLELLPVSSCPKNRLAGFNSDMVRLESSIAVISVLTGEFQFRYGSIRIAFDFNLSIGILMFQFRYGSIRIKGVYVKPIDDIPFQFRYGSIRI